ncbi:MAG: peptidoglycan DD-metalloendopeptidase family protein [Acidobacteriota bacterium]
MSWLAWGEHWGERWLTNGFTQAVYAAVVFLAVAAILRLWRSAPPAVQAGLWSLVLIRLLMPVDLASPWSARTAVESWIAIPSWTAPPASLGGIAPVSEAEVFGVAADSATPLPPAHPLPIPVGGPARANGSLWSAGLCLLWGAGAFGTSVLLVLRRRALRRRIQRGREVREGALREVVAHWRQRLRVRRTVRLVVGAGGPPCTLGVLRPVIYLPEALVAEPGAGEPAAVEAVVAHEMAHIRRYDVLRLAFQNVVQILYFFHPLAWLAASRATDARERLVDGLVLSSGHLDPKTYAASLLAVLRLDHATSPSADLSPAPGMGGNPQRRLTLRLHHILDRPRTRPFAGLLGGLLCLLLALVLLPMAGFAGEVDPPPAPNAPNPGQALAAPPVPEIAMPPALPRMAPVPAPPAAPAPVPSASDAVAAPSVLPRAEAVPLSEAPPLPAAPPAPSALPQPEALSAPPAPPAAPRGLDSRPSTPAPPAAPAAPSEEAVTLRAVSPLADTCVTSAFGWRADPRSGGARQHQGVDLKAPRGTEVRATADGRVVVAEREYGEDGAWGLTVVIDHGEGVESVYAHLDTKTVLSGETVEAGQVIGTVGDSGWATGVHLHFGMRNGNSWIDPFGLMASPGPC